MCLLLYPLCKMKWINRDVALGKGSTDLEHHI